MAKAQPSKTKETKPQPQSSPLVVPGSGNAQVDVSAVQSAVDRAAEEGRAVHLTEKFDFGTQQVTIKGWASIYGFDRSGNRAIVIGGESPFVVDSNTQAVTIRGVHFVKTKRFAVEIKSVNGLTIDACKVEGPMIPTSGALHTAGGIAGKSALPRNITGKVEITNNEIDIDPESSLFAVDPSVRTFGIQLDLQNQNGKAEIAISRNKIRNVTAHGVIVRNVTGTTIIGVADSLGDPTPNEITTGIYGGRIPETQSFVDGIMCQGAGNYHVLNNVIDSGYYNSAGIRLVDTSKAQVDSNTIDMSSQRTSNPTSDLESAAIECRGSCTGSQVQNNVIDGQGQARAVISLIAATGTPNPNGNGFTNNTHSGFRSSLADIFIDANFDDTAIHGGTGGTMVNGGNRTTVDPALNYQ